jgi:hypothetical protein
MSHAKKATRSALLLSAFVGVLLYAQNPNPQRGWIDLVAPATRNLVRDILDSPTAEFLSGSGRNALELIIRGTTPPQVGVATTQDKLPYFELFPSQPQLATGEVRVNNPEQDLRTLEDITTQSEPAVAGYGRTVVVAYNDSGQFTGFLGSSFMGYSRSADGGLTFTDLGPIPGSLTGASLGDPGLAVDRLGNFYAAGLAVESFRPPGTQNTIGIWKSTNSGLSWAPPVYPPPGTAGFSDKPFIVVDTTQTRTSGNVYVSWTQFGAPIPGVPLQVPIFFSRSTDGGISFSPAIQISQPGDNCQGSEPAVGPSGEVYVTWMRWAPAPAAIFVAKSLNGGATFGPPVVVRPIMPIGFRLAGGPIGILTGNFRVNSFPRIDVNRVNGHVYIVYNANPPGPDGADVFFVRSTNGGTTWSEPIRVNDDTGEFDQFFPDVAANGAGNVQVMWYDRRNGGNLGIDVYTARMNPGGQSFQPNTRLTSEIFRPAVGYDPVVNPQYMGDYNDIKAHQGPNGPAMDFLTAWGDFRRRLTTAGGRRNDQDVIFRRLE